MQIVEMDDDIVVRCLRHDIAPQAITKAAEIERIRKLAETYNTACAARPFANRIVLAFNIGAKVFGLNASDLIENLRRYSTPRQQLMAFTYVVGHGKHGYKPIGRVFHREHATVIHAVKKYEAAMRELVL